MNKTKLTLDKNKYINFFTRCNSYKIVPYRLIEFFMEEINNHTDLSEEFIKKYLLSNNRAYTSYMEKTHTECQFVKNLIENDELKHGDISQEDIRKYSND